MQIEQQARPHKTKIEKNLQCMMATVALIRNI